MSAESSFVYKNVSLFIHKCEYRRHFFASSIESGKIIDKDVSGFFVRDKWPYHNFEIEFDLRWWRKLFENISNIQH